MTTADITAPFAPPAEPVDTVMASALSYHATTHPADDDQREHLHAALYHLDQARLQAMLRPDAHQADRLQAIHDRTTEELQLLPDFTLRLYPTTEPGRRLTLGWILRHDPHVRGLRRTRGLPLPEGTP